MLITILFYADDVRDTIWKFVFKFLIAPREEGPAVYASDSFINAVRGSVSRDDPELNRLVLRRVQLMLVAGAARVLRILEDTHETLQRRADPALRRRHASFVETVESHMLSPGELCAISTSAAVRPYVPVEKGIATSVYYQKQIYLLKNVVWALSHQKKVPVRFKADDKFNAASETLVAMTTTLFETVSHTDPTVRFDERNPDRTESHAVALIRVKNQWYVSDDNIGFLLLLQKEGDQPGKSSVRQSDIDLTFLETVRTQVPGEPKTNIVYNLRSTLDWNVVVARTQPIVKDGTYAIFTMREGTGIYNPRPRGSGAAAHGGPGPAAAGAGAGEEAEVTKEDMEKFKMELYRVIIHKVGRVYVTSTMRPWGPPAGGKRRYSRKVRQWGRKKGVGSSTRRGRSKARR
jgi:hypothetical protein